MGKTTTKHVMCFFGTRPEAIKMAPVAARLRETPRLRVSVVVSAQHREMLDQVLRGFHLRVDEDLNLMRKGQSLPDLTARALQAFDPVLQRRKPDLVLVHGDTTTSLAGALAAFYRQIPVGHVEAGLRTHDLARPFPEEANRRLTDALCTLLFPPTQGAARNLAREGHAGARVFVTGNTVIDALLTVAAAGRRPAAAELRRVFKEIQSNNKRLILMTAHRRENFGRPFERIFSAVARLARRFPDTVWVYPVHPNPNVRVPARRLLSRVPNVYLTPPLGYADMVAAMKQAHFVVTDSGGLQEEAPSLGKPVLVLRDVTERPEAVRAGTVRVVGTDGTGLTEAAARLLRNERFYARMAGAVNPYGDGRASWRIAHAIQWHLGLRSTPPTPFGSRS